METHYQESSEELKPGEIKQAVKKVLESPEEVKAIVEKVKDIFKEEKEELEDEDVKLAIEDRPEDPYFPFAILIVAVLKDIIDFGLELTLVGIILIRQQSVSRMENQDLR